MFGHFYWSLQERLLSEQSLTWLKAAHRYLYNQWVSCVGKENKSFIIYLHFFLRAFKER